MFPLIFVSTAFGQSTEYSFHMNSGLFSFAGPSVTNTSFIMVNNLGSGNSYTNNPYGSHPTVSYEVGFQVQHINANHLIWGIQLGYALFRSRVSINRVYVDSPYLPLATHGHTILENRFFNLYPNIGYRFMLPNLMVDLTAGPGIGFDLNSREMGKAFTYFNTMYTTDTNRHNPGMDIRVRAGFTVYYKNWGLSAGYSYGLRNYSGGMIGVNPEMYARIIRFGVVYRVW